MTQRALHGVLHAPAFLTAVCLAISSAGVAEAASASSEQAELNAQVNRPVDIASSAYQYRADRKAEENPPESWLAIMYYAKLPLNKPLNVNHPAIKHVLRGLLWEEIRPVQQLVLTWAAGAHRQPAPQDLTITTLTNQGSASTWWNNTGTLQYTKSPAISADTRTYVYELQSETCGIVVSVAQGKKASDYDVPAVQVLVADVWKKMDVEVEWAFDTATAPRDYSGRVETYDGRVADFHPLERDTSTKITGSHTWQSQGQIAARRGMRFSLLYMGTSKWRKEQPFTSQRDDVARTIITLWTNGGNFSFLAADLENGPILAPEYGFFVRRTSKPAPSSSKEAINKPIKPTLLGVKLNSIAGDKRLLCWIGNNEVPWFGGNPTDKPIVARGIALPRKRLAMHPGPQLDVAVGWRSPISGRVSVNGSVAHAQAGGNGIEWSIQLGTKTGRKILDSGVTEGTGFRIIPTERNAKAVSQIAIEPGEMVALVVGPKGGYAADSTLVDFVITEVGGAGRVWNLTRDVVGSIHVNPHPDSLGDAGVWQFYTEKSRAEGSAMSSEPPIQLDSSAASAREFIHELQGRKLLTIRQQIRSHEEQSWEGAVTAMHSGALPPHPQPPAGFEPPMQVHVPSERLTAQWNLGNWHLLRHAARNPKDGRLWFADYPYGILAAETHLILAVLDMMGSHQAAADGFEQWVSLPVDIDPRRFPTEAFPDRPTGLFSDGHGALTHAVGPERIGGQMDGVHAFGPGSIGLSLTEHYWMTGDTKWLERSAPRIEANAQWMLRQRRLMASVFPGGDRLWCKGLQPALQVTPDSGGLWMQFYECEAYYWTFISRLAITLNETDAEGAAKLRAEAEAYRADLLRAVERSIALSPVVPVRDGTFHSVIPFACYVRGLSTGSWGWLRDGSGSHVGPLYWETVQSAAALISTARLLPADDVRVQGYFDVLEDRLLLENSNVNRRCNGDWFSAGWQYQGGLERTANMHLVADDVPAFLRTFLNGYAVDVIPESGYIFNEHAVHGPPDKIFEEAAFLERFRDLLVMEDGENLWLARASPRAWLQQGKQITVKNAPTHFGNVDYEIVSDVDHGKISAVIRLPTRRPVHEVWLRLRHPTSASMKSVTVNGKMWKDFDPSKEIVKLHDLTERLDVDVSY